MKVLALMRYLSPEGVMLNVLFIGLFTLCGLCPCVVTGFITSNVINRPGVAGAVLHTASSLIK